LPHVDEHARNVPRWQLKVAQHVRAGHGMTWLTHPVHSEAETTLPPGDCMHVAWREYEPDEPHVAVHEPLCV
jgi:hypothetical protein